MTTLREPAPQAAGRPTRRALLFSAMGWLGQSQAQTVGLDHYRNPTTWLDDAGHPWQLESLRGHHSVLTLAYGACRRICSTSLRVMENLQRLADERGQPLDFVVIGLDPAEDKPVDWADLRQQRRLLRPNWHFLWGDSTATRAVAQRLGVKVWRVDSHLMHDYRIVLLSPQGHVLRAVDRFDQPLDTLLPG